MIYVTPIVKTWDKRFQFEVISLDAGTAKRYYTAPLGRGLYTMENDEEVLVVPGHQFNLLGTNGRRKTIEFAAGQSEKYLAWLRAGWQVPTQSAACEWYRLQLEEHFQNNGGSHPATL